ncbi:MAG: choice-of-anchor tandem repeat GloVer-containing protein [Candidatus Korobacteraceae bacterium]
MSSQKPARGNCKADIWMTLAAMVVAVLMIVAATQMEAQTLTVLHTFTGNGDGGVPFAGLTIDQAGNFYGTTSIGGAGYGTVFKLTHLGSSWILSTLYAFQGGNDGGYPYARVVFGRDGALYGTTSGYGNNAGYGTVFRLTPPSHPCRSINCPWTETVLYPFAGGADGADPGYGDLAFDAAGNIYGTTMFGGGEGGNCSPYDNCGVVFKLSRSGESWTESVLYSFSQVGNAGDVPEAGVILDSAGNLYGTTLLGGTEGQGVVFQLTQSGSGWTLTVLHSFGAINDGAQPFGGLVIDQQGNLYGTTIFGTTTQNGGTIYELQPAGGSWSYSIVNLIPGSDFTIGPEDVFTVDAAGNLYATNYSSSRGAGSVFKLTHSGGSWTYTGLHDFTGHDGAYPSGSVVLDAHGNIYGTTSNFEDGYGEIWEITP